MRYLIACLFALLFVSVLSNMITDPTPRSVLYMDPSERQYNALLRASLNDQNEAEKTGDRVEVDRLRRERLELVEEWKDHVRQERLTAFFELELKSRN